MILEVVIVLIYAICLLTVLLFAITQVFLFLKFREARSQVIKNELSAFSLNDHLPRVTIQLPLYNEQNVVQALLEHVAAIEYPRDRLDIQVLDDSTDDTSALVQTLVAEFSARGIEMIHLKRNNRDGFKDRRRHC